VGTVARHVPHGRRFAQIEGTSLFAFELVARPLSTSDETDQYLSIESAGVDDPEGVLDDPGCVEWRGGHAHECDAA
jgi:hypothetical protein